jgi:hypothetical protein
LLDADAARSNPSIPLLNCNLRAVEHPVGMPAWHDAAHFGGAAPSFN